MGPGSTFHWHKCSDRVINDGKKIINYTRNEYASTIYIIDLTTKIPISYIWHFIFYSLMTDQWISLDDMEPN